MSENGYTGPTPNPDGSPSDWGGAKESIESRIPLEQNSSSDSRLSQDSPSDSPLGLGPLEQPPDSYLPNETGGPQSPPADIIPMATMANYDYSNVEYREYEFCSVVSEVVVEATANMPPGVVGIMTAEMPPVSAGFETVREMLADSEAARGIAKEIITEICNVMGSIANAPSADPVHQSLPEIRRP
jgi:hypothetical protein